MAIPNITNRKRPTHSPESDAEVMLVNILD
jgi:hypothetical protein